MTKCRAFACSKTAGTFSAYCSTHKGRLRKQGHEDQQSITKTQLRPYINLVKARRNKNPDNPVWEGLTDRWNRLVGQSHHILVVYSTGQPMIDSKRQAAEEVVRLGATVDPMTIVETALAMFIMLDLDPRAFHSDKAFMTQLVRRVVRLSEANAQSYVGGSDRPKRAYRDLTPRTAEILGDWLSQSFGVSGLVLAKLERKDQQDREKERRYLYKSLDEII